MKYRRMPIEEASPELLGYDQIRYNLAESSVSDRIVATSLSRSTISTPSCAIGPAPKKSIPIPPPGRS